MQCGCYRSVRGDLKGCCRNETDQTRPDQIRPDQTPTLARQVSRLLSTVPDCLVLHLSWDSHNPPPPLPGFDSTSSTSSIHVWKRLLSQILKLTSLSNFLYLCICTSAGLKLHPVGDFCGVVIGRIDYYHTNIVTCCNCFTTNRILL